MALSIRIAAVISWILSITAIALVIYWMVHFHDGYKFGIWHYKDHRIFNYHPLFMIIGLTFIAPTGLYQKTAMVGDSSSVGTLRFTERQRDGNVLRQTVN